MKKYEQLAREWLKDKTSPEYCDHPVHHNAVMAFSQFLDESHKVNFMQVEKTVECSSCHPEKGYMDCSEGAKLLKSRCPCECHKPKEVCEHGEPSNTCGTCYSRSLGGKVKPSPAVAEIEELPEIVPSPDNKLLPPWPFATQVRDAVNEDRRKLNEVIKALNAKK